jgi:hypothetical protein
MSPATQYGTSYTATLSTATPAAAASSASAPPEETPYRCADPPASATSAPRSSTSRSSAYGWVSPLWPQPRRA